MMLKNNKIYFWLKRNFIYINMEKLKDVVSTYARYKIDYEDKLKRIEDKLNKIKGEFFKGEVVLYCTNNNSEPYKRAVINEIHYNDTEPYFTIIIDGENSEKQTVLNRLKKMK